MSEYSIKREYMIDFVLELLVAIALFGAAAWFAIVGAEIVSFLLYLASGGFVIMAIYTWHIIRRITRWEVKWCKYR